VHRDAVRLLQLLAVDAELSVALVGDEEMRTLNARYRKKDRPTDVLSFGVTSPSLPRWGPGGGRSTAPRDPLWSPLARGTRLLGDVVISVDTAARQAAARGVPVDEELRFLLAHGVLHLLGYDHERSPTEARRMFAKQRRLLRDLEDTGAGCRVSGVGSDRRSGGNP
jgi:probable rRNA maturation factor